MKWKHCLHWRQWKLCSRKNNSPVENRWVCFPFSALEKLGRKCTALLCQGRVQTGHTRASFTKLLFSTSLAQHFPGRSKGFPKELIWCPFKICSSTATPLILLTFYLLAENRSSTSPQIKSLEDTKYTKLSASVYLLHNSHCVLSENFVEKCC